MEQTKAQVKVGELKKQLGVVEMLDNAQLAKVSIHLIVIIFSIDFA